MEIQCDLVVRRAWRAHPLQVLGIESDAILSLTAFMRRLAPALVPAFGLPLAIEAAGAVRFGVCSHHGSQRQRLPAVGASRQNVEGRSSEIETPVPRGAASNGTGVLCANGEGMFARIAQLSEAHRRSRLCRNRVNTPKRLPLATAPFPAQ